MIKRRVSVLPEQYAGRAAVEDCGDALIVQYIADLHLRPSTPLLGMGMICPCWTSSTLRLSHGGPLCRPGLRPTVYRQLAQELAAHGTTRVLMFSSLHADATLILITELERAGITGYVGGVNMDRNAAPRRAGGDYGESMGGDSAGLDALRDFKNIRPHADAPVHPLLHR